MSEQSNEYRVTYDVTTGRIEAVLDPKKTPHASFSGQNLAQEKDEFNLPEIAAAIKNDWQTLKPGEQASLMAKIQWFMQENGLDRKKFEQMIKTRLMAELLDEAGYAETGLVEVSLLDVLNKNLGTLFGDKAGQIPLEVSIGTGRMNTSPLPPPDAAHRGIVTPPAGYVPKENAVNHDVFLRMRLSF